MRVAAVARACVAAMLVVGCGRVAFEQRSDAGDALGDAMPDAFTCPPQYTREGASCYRTITTPRTWLAAEADCESHARGAHLAVVGDAAEAQLLQAYLPGATDFAWIGGTDSVTEGAYRTVTNEQMTYLAWSTAEPEGALEDCLVLVSIGQISDNVCTGMDDYICEYDGKPAVSPAWGVCPTGYTFAGAGCYRAALGTNGQGASWQGAEAACEADGPGSHLVVVDSAAEAAVVDGIAPGTIVDHWVGASDLVVEGVFVSVTDGPFGHSVWEAGEPDGGTNENCVLFNDAQMLSTSDCTTIDDSVCEYDGIDAVPAAYGQ